jgi:uncharacterized protein YgbK (DUF1537 family)
MIYLLADDLTGANDGAVQLAKKGLRTLVYIEPLGSHEDDLAQLRETVDVLAVDTETRGLSADEAGEVIRRAVSKLGLTNQTGIQVYKKIDSTLRGNVGKEIEVLMTLLEKDVCVLAPSYPQHRRVVVGGYLLVDNRPLGLTQYFQSKLPSWIGSYIPSLLREQTRLPVGLIELKTLMQGEEAVRHELGRHRKAGTRIIVFDAVTEEHLQAVVNYTSLLGPSVLYCGSAGLADFIISQSGGSEHPPVLTRAQGPVLIVVGTRNKIMEGQISYLKERIPACHIRLDPTVFLNQPEQALEAHADLALQALSSGEHVLLQTVAAGGWENDSAPHREREISIRNFVSELSAEIARTANIRDLIIIGGDTALGICTVLGAGQLQVEAELLPGIPLVSVESGEHRGMRIITKAGGFGVETTLYELVSSIVEN